MIDRAFVPIYQRLFEFYKERIIKQEYLPGSRVDSINRIITRHNVSRETAKLVLNKLSEEGFIIKKAGKGSFVTYTRETQQVWGVVIPFYSTNIEDLIANLNNEAQKVDRSVRYFLHYNEPEEEIRLVGNMLRQGYEAVIIVPNYDESLTADFYRNLNQGNSIVLLVDNTMGGSFFSYVIQSYDLGVKRAINYLTYRNDKNLLFFKNEIWRGRNLVYELMEQSIQIFIDQQAPARKLYVISGLSGFNQEFIIRNNIGGILCSTDIDSLKVTGRLNRWGIKMPDQVSVVSYGNTELTQSATPSVTAVDCNYGEMAKLTASLIFDCDTKITKQFVIQPEIIIRQT
ncbi:MAG: substrate-binding domain-containing protein [Bacteroidales bacterium]